MPSRARKQLEDWVSIPRDYGKVLDVGGSQNPVSKRIKASEIMILDLPQPHETKQKPDIIGDIQDMTVPEHLAGTFDTAFCLEVSEYWHDPVSALKNIHKFLRPGGELYISFHSLYILHDPHGEDCLRYTHNGVRKIMQSAGFVFREDADSTVKTLKPENKARLEAIYKSEGMRGLYGNQLSYAQGFLCSVVKPIPSA